MTKTLAAAKRQERVKFKVPRSVQDAIPIRRIWPDGIFQVGNQYSKSWSFTDINYAIADKRSAYISLNLWAIRSQDTSLN